MKNYEREKVDHGLSGDTVYKLKRNGNVFYLKISSPDRKDLLEREIRNIEWLGNYLPVPKVLDVGTAESNMYVLMSEIPGIPLHLSDEKPQKLISIMADGLKLFHSVDIPNCPLNQRLEVKLAAAFDNIKKGRVNTDFFEERNRNRLPEQIYEELLKQKPDEDLVLCHGDYCLPNILVYKGKLSGFIDLGLSGVSDRYQDLAIGARSIAYNIGEKYIQQFLEEYGLENPDERKMRYYRDLDELF
ncbi:hypothetical protein IX53_08290 [Kosmotoga pacifica]|uniref:Aminoglycoside phosphotransferase domain-containing protein n=1 Tax=Kosmotoga pacifica TaxID=1330330 RepID=A0A0G2Z9P4_9BACT|nr:hypothetical protein IX53_08290 [Kosmotoga pacifica]